MLGQYGHLAEVVVAFALSPSAVGCGVSCTDGSFEFADFADLFTSSCELDLGHTIHTCSTYLEDHASTLLLVHSGESSTGVLVCLTGLIGQSRKQMLPRLISQASERSGIKR